MSSHVLRLAVRVAIFDPAGAILLLSTRDASNVDFTPSWELPGGGVLGGESFEAAALREVREETGLELPTSSLSSVLWQRDVLYTYRGERRLQRESIYVARVTTTSPCIETSGREPFEREDHLQYRWWPIDGLRTARSLFFPRTLPAHIDRLYTGTPVDDPSELWD